MPLLTNPDEVPAHTRLVAIDDLLLNNIRQKEQEAKAKAALMASEAVVPKAKATGKAKGAS